MTIANLASSALNGPLSRTFILERNAQGIPLLVLVFDVVESETPEFTANVSMVPVEDNQAEITDHVQIVNPTLNLTGVISESPIDLSVQIANIVGSGLQLATNEQARTNLLNSGLGSVAGALGPGLLGGASAGGLAGGAIDIISRQVLLSAYERAARLTVVTRRQQFSNMVIKKISFPRDRSTGRQTRFQIEFQQIRVVAPIQATVETIGDSVVVSATPSQSIGSQTLNNLSGSISSAIEMLPFVTGG